MAPDKTADRGSGRFDGASLVTESEQAWLSNSRQGDCLDPLSAPNIGLREF